MKTLKKHNHEDTNSDSNSKHEYYCMDDVGLDLKDVNASKTIALSDLHRPPQKCQKIDHLTPVTIVLIKTWLGKSRFKKIRILLGSRSSGSIILENFVCKQWMQNDTTTSWITKGGNFQKSKKCKTTFILMEFFKNKSIEWNLHVDSTPSPHHYDMILGHDIMSELGITLNFKDQMMTWDDSTINMKDPESLPDLLNPVNDFSGTMIIMRQRHFKRLLSISRKFSMRNTNRRTSAWSYRRADTSLKMRNISYMPQSSVGTRCLEIN